MNDNIYVVNARGTNLYKVGVTNDINVRIVALQTGCPHPIELVELRSHNDAYKGEARIHEALAAHRVQGEWFSVENYGTIRWAVMQECEGDLLFGKVFYWGKDIEPSAKMLKITEIASDPNLSFFFKLILTIWCAFLPTTLVMKQRDLTDLEMAERYAASQHDPYVLGLEHGNYVIIDDDE